MVRLTYKFGHIIRLIHGLKGRGIYGSRDPEESFSFPKNCSTIMNIFG